MTKLRKSFRRLGANMRWSVLIKKATLPHQCAQNKHDVSNNVHFDDDGFDHYSNVDDDYFEADTKLQFAGSSNRRSNSSDILTRPRPMTPMEYSSPDDYGTYVDESSGLFAAVFRGEAGFEELRKNTKRTNDVFKEVTAVLTERAEQELAYSKHLMKLSSRLDKVATQANGLIIDSAWRHVGDSFAKTATQHHTLGIAIRDELAHPLKNACEIHNKMRKTVENVVDKTMKQLVNRRSEALRHKQKCHAKGRDLEILDKTLEEEKHRAVKQYNERQIARMHSKRSKLLDSLVKSELKYHYAAFEGERHRNTLEFAYMRAAGKLENLEQQRLMQMQTALSTYERRIMPLLTSSTSNMTTVVDQLRLCVAAPIDADLNTIVSTTRPKTVAYKNLLLCDYYHEDFCQLMSPERRRVGLERLLAMFQKEVVKERRGKEGLEYLSTVYEKVEPTMNEQTQSSVRDKLRDARTILNYLDYHIYKIQLGLCALDKNTNGTFEKPIHPLSKYEERIKDKATLRQTVLRVPLYDCDDLSAPVKSIDYNQGSAEHEPATGSQSHTRSLRDSPPMKKSDLDNTELYSEASNSESNVDSRASSLCRSFKDGKNIDQHFSFLDNKDDQGEIVEALYDFVPQRGDELPLIKGDRIRVMGRESADWWEGIIMGTEIHGYFPTNYITKTKPEPKMSKMEEESEAEFDKDHGKFDNEQVIINNGEKDNEIEEQQEDNHYESITQNGDA